MADTNKIQAKAAIEQLVEDAPADKKYTLEDAIALIAQSMAAQTQFQKSLSENAPRRKKTMGEYLAEHPRKRLLHDTFQNGRPVNPSGLSQETLLTLDTFATGTYCDGLIDVVRIRDGAKGIASRIHIMYNNKSDAQKMEMYMRFPTFTALVKAVAADMAAQGIKPVSDPVEDDRVWQEPQAPRDASQ
jgi:hypothetical protein